MNIIKTNQIEIAYEISGSGTAGHVVLIRGQGTQLIHWPETFIEAFSDQGYKSIRFDNRDTGLSQKFDQVSGTELASLKQSVAEGKAIKPPYTMDDMVLDVVALMDGLNIDKAHIVGISMGGFIAQLMAAEFPERTFSMTSIMSASGDIDPALIDTLWLVPRSRDQFIQEWVEYIQCFGSKKYFEGDDYSRRTAADAFDRCYSPDGANRQLLAIFSMKNTREIVKTVAVPTLVVHGTDDLLIPPAKGQETADLIQGSKFHLVDGMGHDIPPKLGRPLAEIVIEYLESVIN